jgi:hypothetical protein
MVQRVMPPAIHQAQAFLAAGNALRAAGRNAEAVSAYRRAIAAAPEGAAGHYNLGLALRDARDWREAILCFRRAAALSEGSDHEAMQNTVSTLARAIGEGASPFGDAGASFPAGRTPISIVVCSVRPAMLEEMRASCREGLAGREHEFIVIDDARSLAEGYNRGLARARHPIVVFSHDDVELLSPRPFDAIEHALASHDVAGLAGAAQVRGPAVMWAGHPHLRGFVALPGRGDPGAVQATLFALDCGVLGGMQALDGFFFAARREAALAVGFDEKTFDGFHFYDLDFTYRAHLAGMKLAVTTDVCALHRSLGNFNEDWKRYSRRFAEKFPALDGARGSNHHYAAPLPSRGHAVRFLGELRALARA